MDWDVESRYDYFGARLRRFLSADPLGGDSRLARWSPYHDSVDNPLGFVDPTGVAPEEVINVDAVDDATKHIQRATSLIISCDETTGKLSASGEAQTDADKALQTAIDDKTNDVRLDAITARRREMLHRFSRSVP